jgi:hypothetical protein
MKFSVYRSALLACAMATASIASAAAETVDVVLDQASIIKTPDRVATIVIGNPSVADASLQAGGLLIVTGKGFGTTNLIALDARGNTLVQYTLRVTAPNGGRLTVWRGADRETWSCAPNCERSVTLGDAAGFFETAVAQIGARNGAAAGKDPSK